MKHIYLLCISRNIYFVYWATNINIYIYKEIFKTIHKRKKIKSFSILNEMNNTINIYVRTLTIQKKTIQL